LITSLLLYHCFPIYFFTYKERIVKIVADKTTQLISCVQLALSRNTNISAKKSALFDQAKVKKDLISAEIKIDSTLSS